VNTRTVRVEVTQEHIKKAVPGVCGECLIAVAISEAMGEPWSVGFTIAYRGKEAFTSGRQAELPRAAVDARVKFDERAPVKPFTFDLEVPV
jgi:hypothetical protein